ncbi:MAG: solute carrier family 13 (sodium-dependent dicarboxylate transporter), er 2/3/5 [Candidatus Sumerlaeota bacterium]|nr:solute carrier family 13 (sodium-dependent dicarboxylate transporter), er 2/3/5 [Candidatus Sumerlaeota bacterium]
MTEPTSPSVPEGLPPGGRLRLAGLFIGVVAAAAVLLFTDLDPGNPAATRTAAIAVLMAAWWITEAVPLAVTALLPIVLFPLLGIQSGKDACGHYANNVIFLFIGGFLMALAMQRWDLHRRIAMRVLRLFGARPGGIVAGFMAATALLSMGISNTATAMMMVPIALAVILDLEQTLGWKRGARIGTATLLAIAYGSSIGGMATLVGTPPNLAFAGILRSTFPEADPVSFGQWIIFALPLALAFLVLLWGWLHFSFLRGEKKEGIQAPPVHKPLGPMGYEEMVVLAACVLLAGLWMFRSDLDVGVTKIPGWARLLENPKFVTDGNVAIAIAVLLFLIPSRRPGTRRILEVGVFSRLPWGIVLLFGGGFALASGFSASGLSEWVGARLAVAGGLPPVLLVALVCLVITFLTEMTSNTASAQILLPVLAALSVQIGMDPRVLMIAGTLSCSCAFMLPVATPPNAIIFGTERISTGDMARTGIVLNVVGVVLVTLLTVYWGRVVFGFSLETLPAWAVLPQ